jgi:hypothetical protein
MINERQLGPLTAKTSSQATILSDTAHSTQSRVCSVCAGDVQLHSVPAASLAASSTRLQLQSRSPYPCRCAEQYCVCRCRSSKLPATDLREDTAFLLQPFASVCIDPSRYRQFNWNAFVMGDTSADKPKQLYIDEHWWVPCHPDYHAPSCYAHS